MKKPRNTIDALPRIKVLVAHLCPTLCNPMGCSPSGFSVHGIHQARIMEWVVMPFSRGYSWPRDWTCVSCIAEGSLTVWATRESPLRVNKLVTDKLVTMIKDLVSDLKLWGQNFVMEGEVRITASQENNLFFSVFSNGLNNEPYGVSYYEDCYEIFPFFFERGKRENP